MDLKFSHNWNNKLDCNVFTTIRLSNRFNISDEIRVFLKNEFLYNAKIIGRSYMFLNKLTDFQAYLDTGYCANETKEIMKKMYKNKKWETQRIYIYLIKKLEED